MSKIYELGLYEKAMPANLSWQEKFEFAKKSGFDYIELSIDEKDEKLARLDWNKAERTNLRNLSFELDCPLKSMCLSGHRRFPLGDPDPKKREKSLEIMQKAIDLAYDLGIRIIQLAGYDTYYDEGTKETEALFAQNLAIACKMAAKKGVTLGFETMETPFMDTVAKAMHYVSLINNPYLGVYPDIGNLQNASLIYGKSATEDIKTGRGHIVAAHLKETIPNHYREIPFGTGHTAYHETITELLGQGVRTFVGEFWYIGSESWQDDLVFAATFLREKLDKAVTELKLEI